MLHSLLISEYDCAYVPQENILHRKLTLSGDSTLHDSEENVKMRQPQIKEWENARIISYSKQ